MPSVDVAPDAAVAAGTVALDPAVGADAFAAVAATFEDLGEVEVKQMFRCNNVALKWFRDTNEDPPGWPTRAAVDLTDKDFIQIGVIDKDKGTSYKFREEERQPWSWRQMLADLLAKDKEKVLNGMGVVSITCEWVPNTYDHKRWHAALTEGVRKYTAAAPVPV